MYLYDGRKTVVVVHMIFLKIYNAVFDIFIEKIEIILHFASQLK